MGEDPNKNGQLLRDEYHAPKSRMRSADFMVIGIARTFFHAKMANL
jgi:hypothetical protein